MRQTSKEAKEWVDIISIHAPVKDATKVQGMWHGRLNDFNPRTREGCDTHNPIGVPHH